MPATARHILVDTETLCLQLKAEIEAGADFADVAKRESSCPSGQQGGDLGTFNPGQMVPEFDNAVFTEEVNKLLGPVKTQFGYHLIEVTRRWENDPEQIPEGDDLDKALAALHHDGNDPKAQSKFYDVFLNTTFCVPTIDPKELDVQTEIEEGQVLPLILEFDGNKYLMIFSNEERLQKWAGRPTIWVPVSGHVLVATAKPPLHIAMNIGALYSKQFLPDEIAWLREVVERYNEAAKQAN